VNIESHSNMSCNGKESDYPERRIPGVSVIVPAYNCARTIIPTLQSVDQSLVYCQNQFAENLAAEVVIVVDSASDATYDVTRTYIDQRNGFQVIKNKQRYALMRIFIPNGNSALKPAFRLTCVCAGGVTT